MLTAAWRLAFYKWMACFDRVAVYRSMQGILNDNVCITMCQPNHRGLPPPFDPRAMPHPGAGPAPGPPMGEPWFDQMPAPPKGFNHHQFCPPFPPDHIHSQMGAHDYRGGGGRGDTRREERDLFFNHQQGMADYHRPPDFSNAASNSQLPGSGGMMSGGNYMLPPDQIIHPDSEIAPGLQFASCRYMYNDVVNCPYTAFWRRRLSYW